MTADEFFAKYNGVGLDFDDYYGDQCVDSVQFYNRDVIGAPPLTGNASDVWYTYPQGFYTRITNTPNGVPVLGDVMIWSGLLNGGPGHIAIFSTGNADTFTSFDQNWPEGSVCHFQAHDYSNVLGWLHPRDAAPTPPPTPPPPTALHVVTAGVLKTQPNHTSPAAIDPHHQPVHLALHAEVLPTGKTQNGWVEVRIPNTPEHGWLPSSAVR